METLFQEIQYYPELAFVLVMVIGLHLLLLYRVIPWVLTSVVCVLLISAFLLLLQQKTIVDGHAIHIQLGWIPLHQHTIPLDEVINERVIIYAQVNDFWGFWQDEKAVPSFIPRTGQSLLLQLKDGSHYLIGSRRIRDLQQAIEVRRENSGSRN